VTICTQDRGCFFGAVAGDETHLNDAGGMVEHWWFELNQRFSAVETDEFVIMPNHLHGIVVLTDTIVGADLRGSALYRRRTDRPGLKTASWPSFNGRLWQRNYYEHVIRNEESLLRIRQYILDNPARWAFDRENPDATAPEPRDPWQ
jgi:putative transposase